MCAVSPIPCISVSLAGGRAWHPAPDLVDRAELLIYLTYSYFYRHVTYSYFYRHELISNLVFRLRVLMLLLPLFVLVARLSFSQMKFTFFWGGGNII